MNNSGSTTGMMLYSKLIDSSNHSAVVSDKVSSLDEAFISLKILTLLYRM